MKVRPRGKLSQRVSTGVEFEIRLFTSAVFEFRCHSDVRQQTRSRFLRSDEGVERKSTDRRRRCLFSDVFKLLLNQVLQFFVAKP